MVTVGGENCAATGHSSLLFYMIKCLFCTYHKKTFSFKVFFFVYYKIWHVIFPLQNSSSQHFSLHCLGCQESDEAGSVRDVSSSGALYCT